MTKLFIALRELANEGKVDFEFRQKVNKSQRPGNF